MAGAIRVLVADDYEPLRRFISLTLEKLPQLKLVGEASDGLEAVQKAQELRADMILLDVSLPKLNGFEVARRILEHVPQLRIIFLSENRSPDIAGAALSTGACGYVLKSDAPSELLPAVIAVLEDRRFVSASLAGRDLTDPAR